MSLSIDHVAKGNPDVDGDDGPWSESIDPESMGRDMIDAELLQGDKLQWIAERLFVDVSDGV